MQVSSVWKLSFAYYYAALGMDDFEKTCEDSIFGFFFSKLKSVVEVWNKVAWTANISAYNF